MIRPETPEDHAAVRRINEEAFGRSAEADLVDALRRAVQPCISLVAEEDGLAVGHIFFSLVEVQSDGRTFTAMGLAPMAVLPVHQGRGIGTGLVRAGLAACERDGFTVVFVVGHPSFYPRFGFESARPRILTCEYNVPDDVFMVKELKPDALHGITGVVKYHPEFGRVE